MRRRRARGICAAAILLCLLPAAAHAETLNVAAGVIQNGFISYGTPEPIAGLCSSFDSFVLLGPAQGGFVSLGGTEFVGDYDVVAWGTTECLAPTVERGLVTSASVSGGSSPFNSTLSCSPMNGSYLRTPGALTLTLSGPCAVNGATVVGTATFQLAGAWKPEPTVSTINPTAITGVRVVDFDGAVEVTPDASVGVGVGPPEITQIDPTRGLTVGGTSVQIHGVGFADGGGSRVRSVTFGAIAATYTVVNDDLIVATAPAEPGGSVPVQVTTDGGSSAQTPMFTYVPPPAVTAVSPSSGGDSAAMTIDGSGFFAGGSSDAVQDITLQCSACGGAIDYPACWTTVSDTEIDIASYCGPTPGYDGFSNKTVFDVVVSTSAAASAINTGDHWTYTRGQGVALATLPILSS